MNNNERALEWLRAWEDYPSPDQVASLAALIEKVAAEAVAAAAARPQWHPIETAPKDEMFIWGYRKDTKFSVGLAYWTVSGRWACAYGSRAPENATHWAPLPAPLAD